MARAVNKVQSEVMLNKMQENRSIACGFVKLSKEVVAEFWNSLTNELNSAGPPMKNVSEWKKVWADQKRYVRSKAAANIKNQRATGGGPNQSKYFSPSEQCIYDLVGMKESVEGLENSLNFGLPDSFGNNENSGDINIELCWEKSVCPDELPLSPQELLSNEAPTSSSKKRCEFLKRKREDQGGKLTTADLIAEELKSQQNLCSKIEEIGDAIQKHNIEMERMVKRVYRSLDKNNELKAKKLKELQRHHEVCEKLRREELKNKLEKNEKLLEFEDLKVKIMQKNTSAYLY